MEIGCKFRKLHDLKNVALINGYLSASDRCFNGRYKRGRAENKLKLWKVFNQHQNNKIFFL